jgi:hypothetical protein
MKHLLFKSATFFLLLLSSCKEKNEDYEVIDWGTLGLQASSRDALPYYGKHTAVFVDSLGEELELGIIGAFDFFIPVNKRTESKFETYTQVYDEFRLFKSTINIWARLTPEFSPAGPQAGEVADFMYIMMGTPNGMGGDTLLSKMVFQGNWPFPVDDNEHYSSITILGREFKDVERRKTPSPSGAEVFYNREFGIVAFRYYDGKLWRFEDLY